jgi:hypothetical protein
VSSHSALNLWRLDSFHNSLGCAQAQETRAGARAHEMPEDKGSVPEEIPRPEEQCHLPHDQCKQDNGAWTTQPGDQFGLAVVFELELQAIKKQQTANSQQTQPRATSQQKQPSSNSPQLLLSYVHVIYTLSYLQIC